MPASTSGLDHGVVGVALSALSLMTRFPVSRGLIGEGAVFIDGIGDVVLMPRSASSPRVRRPDLEILAAMAGRRMHETGSGVVGDVIAREQRELEN